MKITPNDIRQHEFRKALAGFSQHDVKEFLESVAVALEELVRENNGLKDEVRRQASAIDDFRDKESTLKEAMLTAQKISTDIKQTSKKEAELIVQEAEMKAERMINDAHQKMIKILDRIQELKLDRDRFASSLRGLLEQHAKLLDATSQAEKTQDQIDQTLAFLKKPNRAE